MKFDQVIASADTNDEILARHLTDGIITVQVGALTFDLTEEQAAVLRGRLSRALGPCDCKAAS